MSKSVLTEPLLCDSRPSDNAFDNSWRVNENRVQFVRAALAKLQITIVSPVQPADQVEVRNETVIINQRGEREIISSCPVTSEGLISELPLAVVTTASNSEASKDTISQFCETESFFNFLDNYFRKQPDKFTVVQVAHALKTEDGKLDNKFLQMFLNCLEDYTLLNGGKESDWAFSILEKIIDTRQINSWQNVIKLGHNLLNKYYSESVLGDNKPAYKKNIKDILLKIRGLIDSLGVEKIADLHAKKSGEKFLKEFKKLEKDELEKDELENVVTGNRLNMSWESVVGFFKNFFS